MQITTTRPQALMPICQQYLLADGSVELSTVHEPVGELSFYTDIYQLGLARRRKRRAVIDFTSQALSSQIIMLSTEEEREARPAAVSAEEIITTAKRVTGLSIKDLAPIFSVTRQTLYNFRKAEERISERNWQRLVAVDREVKRLAEILPSSLGSLSKHFVYEEETLHGLLCAPQLDSPKIQRLARALAAQLSKARYAKPSHSTSLDQLTRHG